MNRQFSIFHGFPGLDNRNHLVLRDSDHYFDDCADDSLHVFPVKKTLAYP